MIDEKLTLDSSMNEDAPVKEALIPSMWEQYQTDIHSLHQDISELLDLSRTVVARIKKFDIKLSDAIDTEHLTVVDQDFATVFSTLVPIIKNRIAEIRNLLEPIA